MKISKDGCEKAEGENHARGSKSSAEWEDFKCGLFKVFA